MNKHKHLTQEDRIVIEQLLTSKESFKRIGRELGKDPTTIAKEIKTHLQFKRTGCYGRPFNDCLHRWNCPVQHFCSKPKCSRLCCFCNSPSCSSLCPDYHKETCSKLLKPPYIVLPIVKTTIFSDLVRYSFLV
jgi:IS30 family transposase